MSKKYDIAISFAGEDRQVASRIATLLAAKGIRVFYDDFEKHDLWGKDLYEYLIDIYKSKATYCLMLLSENYSKKLWTNHERKAAQARAFKEQREYILPLRLDDVEIDSILETTGYLDFRNETVESVVAAIERKLWGNFDNNPIIDVLKSQLEDIYYKVMYLCENVLLSPTHPELIKGQFFFECHARTNDLLQKLKQDFSRNETNLEHLVALELTKFINNSEKLWNIVGFLDGVSDPRRKSHDFILDTPKDELVQISDFLIKLKIFGQQGSNSKKRYNPTEILNLWQSVAEETKVIFFDCTKYDFKNDRQVNIFNYVALRKFGSENMKHGQPIHVYCDSN